MANVRLTQTERINEYTSGDLVSYLNQLVRLLKNNFNSLETSISYKSNYADSTVIKASPYGVVKLLPVFLCDTTLGALVVNLPSAEKYPKKFATFKRIKNTADTVTLTPNGSETIDEQTSLVLAGSTYDSVTIYSDGFNWWVL